jgi:alcohol dehydrogenase class IV
MWKYSNPVQINFSDNFVEQLALIIGDNEKPNILVFSYEWFKNTENYIRLKNVLGDFNFWGDIEENPSFTSCQNALDFTEKLQPNIIIAIGGGSVIDTAKVVRMAIYKSCYDIQKLFTSSSKHVNKPLFIAVPTTHGTSSELTMWTTIWDKVNKKKNSLSEYNNYPDYAIYDVGLIKSLPIHISLSSTLDALSHSFEALWNKHSNPISDNFAMYAIKLIIGNLDKLVEPVPIKVRKNLLMASIYAGLAFSNTKTAAAHSISYPLSAYFNIPHGIACSMPLYPLMKINKKAIHNKIDALLNVLQLKSIDEVLNKVVGTVKNKIPFNLHEYGVKKADLDWLLDLTFTKGRMDNNIVDLSKKEVMEILKEIY